MPARSRPEIPQALHLARLAQGTPGQWVALPGGQVRCLNLNGRVDGPALAGWLVCLTGEAVVDLPLNNFVCLRASESYRLRAEEPWSAFETKAGTVLLLIPDA
ncbi:hypothetical protein DEDE109153_05010 [Deinococcus deserti]|uniref:Uncharacterized protein n=1 Tax=Deinococcus deserti (strain DSM 17065 / CIP 109153 / LMG 22923 / VCD115) TaxID=546414 RepID=C1D175_DEIDV|nr:hypothetical protein [Deinococcus deserti]ACO45599.1 hypothetical protein Deide_07420 [Deinococcus deserti VCD115]